MPSLVLAAAIASNVPARLSSSSGGTTNLMSRAVYTLGTLSGAAEPSGARQ